MNGRGELEITLAALTATAAGAYRAMRGLGFTAHAAQHAITVQVSDTITTCQQQIGDICGLDDEGGGGVLAPDGTGPP